PGEVANMSIGQGQITVTPLQMACMTAAIANGGRVLYPRLVKDIDGMPYTAYPGGQVRSYLKLNPTHLDIIQRAMLADVMDPSGEGTGRAAYIPNFLVGGKTGTAEIKGGNRTDKITWFASYGPFEAPRYAVIVMVESGASGGKTCAPVARKVYEAIQKMEAGRAVMASSQTN
ncbi:MAG: penicillin-binding transpeptidase domain-containing protein, partial [Limisphaerales bacterium]